MRRTLLLLCLAPCLLAAAKRPLTIDDTLEMVRLDDVLISPDGDRVFYSEQHLDWDENKFVKKFFMIPARGDFDVSPDGNRVVFNARPDNRRNYPFLSELYLIDTRQPGLRRLTENEAPEQKPAWAPDGKTIAYHAPDDKVFELTNGFIWIMNPDTGDEKRLQGQNLGEIDDLVWMPDGKSLIFNESRRTNANLYRIDLGTDEVTPLTNAAGTLRTRGFSADRTRMVYTFADFDTPPDLYASGLAGADPVRLTRANPWIEEEIQLGTGQVLRWKSKDGTEMEGVLLLPDGYEEGARIPLMLQIHGGPSGYWANDFELAFHLFAGLGYASLGPNVRGSSGYGDGILRGLMGDVGGGEFDDLMSGVAFSRRRQGLTDSDGWFRRTRGGHRRGRGYVGLSLARG